MAAGIVQALEFQVLQGHLADAVVAPDSGATVQHGDRAWDSVPAAGDGGACRRSPGYPAVCVLGGYGVPQAQPGPEQEKNILRNQAEALKADLEIITRRLQALETEAADE